MRQLPGSGRKVRVKRWGWGGGLVTGPAGGSLHRLQTLQTLFCHFPKSPNVHIREGVLGKHRWKVCTVCTRPECEVQKAGAVCFFACHGQSLCQVRPQRGQPFAKPLGGKLVPQVPVYLDKVRRKLDGGAGEGASGAR